LFARFIYLTIENKSSLRLGKKTMKNSNGLAVPKKSEMKDSTIFEELSTVKMIGNNVLMQQSVCVKPEVIENNRRWRQTTFESFEKRVHLVAKEYTGGIDENQIVIEPPIVLDVLGEDGEPDLDTKVIVNFTAIIPTNIGRKELH
tara:strand:+ start:49 stop:483 length:435 start_codon:yes stop_codon:yes gene_type:complete